MLILGNSILEGIGTALLIPPVYILATLLFPDLTARARAFGAIMAMGGIGAATGPLIGGLIASTLSWRVASAFQALVIVAIVLLSRSIRDPLPPDPTHSFDTGGAILADARPARPGRDRPGVVLPIGARQGKGIPSRAR